VDSSPAVVGGFVFVGSSDHNVYCLNANTGARVWNCTTGGSVSSSPAVVGGFVFVGSGDGKVYCLNATTGAKVWSYQTGGSVSSPAAVNGVVYAGSGDGKIYAFSTPAVRSTGGVVGITGYKLVFKETMNNTLGSQATIDYSWNFSIAKWNGAAWVASGISGSSTSVTGFVIPSLTTEDLPYYVYLLPTSGPNAVAWGNWLKISFTFNWNYSGTHYSTGYTTELNVHPGDINGAKSVTFTYLGAEGVVNLNDVTPIALNWQKKVPASTDPTSVLARADINGDGIVNLKDVTYIALYWLKTWTNTPPPA
jgi:hypothetical protein